MDDELNDTANRLRQGVLRLGRRLRFSATGSMSPAQISILAWLDRKESLTLGEIATLEQVRPPSITPLVRGLESEGLIECTKDEADRRSTRVRLTARGRQELDAVRRRRTEFLEQKLLTLSPLERATAAELATFLERLLEDS